MIERERGKRGKTKLDIKVISYLKPGKPSYIQI